MGAAIVKHLNKLPACSPDSFAQFVRQSIRMIPNIIIDNYIILCYPLPCISNRIIVGSRFSATPLARHFSPISTASVSDLE